MTGQVGAPLAAPSFLIRAFLIRAFLIRAFLIRAFLIRAFLICAFLICAFLIRAFLICTLREESQEGKEGAASGAPTGTLCGAPRTEGRWLKTE